MFRLLERHSAEKRTERKPLRASDIQPNFLPTASARAYWQRLGEQHLTFPTGSEKLPFQYGHPVTFSRNAAQQLVASAGAAETLLREKVREVGLTQHLESHPTTFAGEVLNDEGVNAILEKRLQDGFRLPLNFDVMVARGEKGNLEFKVLELQATASNYILWLEGMAKAAQQDPNNPNTWQGPQKPVDVLSNVKQQLAGGNNVTLVDTDPFEFFLGEQIPLAKVLGDEKSLPVRAQDIEWDEEKQQYYYYRYQINPETGLPFFDKQRNPIKTEEKVLLTHYLSRMHQVDLDALAERVKGTPKTALLSRFFKDSQHVTPIWHPSWQLIGDKNSLKEIRQQLLDTNSPYAPDYVAVHTVGEKVPAGEWYRKVTNGVGNMDVSRVVVEEGQEVVVDAGYVYQEAITLFPVGIPTDHEVASVINADKHIDARRRSKRKQHDAVESIVEIRFSSPLYGTAEELSGRFMARVAPFYDGPQTTLHPKTGMEGIMGALYKYLNASEELQKDPRMYELFPFGWAPVIMKG